MFGKTYYAWVFGVVLASETAIIIAIRLLHLQTDLKVGLVAFTATPLLVISLMELGRNLRLQRAAFIKDYVSQFFTNPDLYQSFHMLIYTYTNSVFDKVDQIRKEQKLDGQDTPVFTPFESLQGDREAGLRFYHPRLFQGSAEERRLDALLGYFDVIAFYYARGYLRIEDIAGSVGYFLAVMKSRRVIDYYMQINREAWSDPEYNRTMGVTPPFAYLQRLLDDIQEYNMRFERHIKALQSRRLR